MQRCVNEIKIDLDRIGMVSSEYAWACTLCLFTSLADGAYPVKADDREQHSLQSRNTDLWKAITTNDPCVYSATWKCYNPRWHVTASSEQPLLANKSDVDVYTAAARELCPVE